MVAEVVEPSPPLRATYSPVEPVDLRLVLGPLSRGRGDPTMRWVEGTLWRTALTPLGSATVAIKPGRHGFEAVAWGPGAGWQLEQLPALLGAGDDPSTFTAEHHPVIEAVHRRITGLRLGRCGLVFEMTVPAILEQKVTGKEARASWRALLDKYGGPAPGPAPAGMRVCPPASVWRRIPSWDYHGAGVGPQRSRTIVAAAMVAARLEATLECGERGGAAITAALRSVPGLGAWTAAEITQRAHGDPDSVSVGDFHLAAFVGWCLLGRPVDDDGMLELLAGFAPHRQRAVRLLELSGMSKPRFAPRYSPQDHRRH